MNADLTQLSTPIPSRGLWATESRQEGLPVAVRGLFIASTYWPWTNIGILLALDLLNAGFCCLPCLGSQNKGLEWTHDCRPQHPPSPSPSPLFPCLLQLLPPPPSSTLREPLVPTGQSLRYPPLLAPIMLWGTQCGWVAVLT